MKSLKNKLKQIHKHHLNIQTRTPVNEVTALFATDPIKGIYEFAKVYPPQYIPEDSIHIINEVEHEVYRDTYPYLEYNGYAFTRDEFREIMKHDPDIISIVELDKDNEIIRFLESKPSDWHRHANHIQTANGTIILLKEEHMSIENLGD